MTAKKLRTNRLAVLILQLIIMVFIALLLYKGTNGELHAIGLASKYYPSIAVKDDEITVYSKVEGILECKFKQEIDTGITVNSATEKFIMWKGKNTYTIPEEVSQLEISIVYGYIPDNISKLGIIGMILCTFAISFILYIPTDTDKKELEEEFATKNKNAENSEKDVKRNEDNKPEGA